MKLMRRQRQPLGNWSSFDQLNRLRDEIDHVFQSSFGNWGLNMGFLEGWTPTVDLIDEKDKFILKAELPGMKKEDIDVSLHGDTVNICGERKKEEEHRAGESYRSERYFGRFQRSVPLPQAVDGNRIEAAYRDGVLTVTLPKTEEAKRKQIEIKAS
jgi:HSP20 family protein